MKAYITDPSKLIPPYKLAVTNYTGRYQGQTTKGALPLGTWTTEVEVTYKEQPSFLKVVGELDKVGLEIVLLNSTNEVVGLIYSDTPIRGHVELYLELDKNINHATQYIDDRNHKLLPSVTVAEQEGTEDNVYVLESETYQIPSPLVYEDGKGSLVITKYNDNFVGEFSYELQEDGLKVDADIHVYTQGVKGDMYAVIGKAILDIRHITAFNNESYLIPFDLKPIHATGKVKLYTRKRLTNKKRLGLLPATRTELGGVIAGSYLKVSKDGELSIDLSSINGVLSLNREVGHVHILTRPVLSVDTEKPDSDGNVKLTEYQLMPATRDRLGGVRPNLSFTIDGTGILNYEGPVKSVNGKTGHVEETFVFTVNNQEPSPRGDIYLDQGLPNTTKNRLGILSVGNGLLVDSSGVMSLDTTSLVTSVDFKKGDVIIDPYVLPKSTTSRLGGVTIGDYVYIDTDGKLQYDTEAIERYYPVYSVNGKQGDVTVEDYILRSATREELGGVRVGSNLIISEDGVLDIGDIVLPDYAVRSVNGEQGDVTLPVYTLPIASEEQLGGVRLGNGFKTLPDGTIYVDKAWLSPPIATRDRLGIIRTGDTIIYDTAGLIRVNTTTMPVMENFNTYGYPILGEDIGYNQVYWNMARLATYDTKGYVNLPPSGEIILQQQGGEPRHVISSAGLRAAKKEDEIDSKGFIIPGRFLAVENGYLVNKFPEVRVWSVNGRLGHVVIDGYVDKQGGNLSLIQESYRSGTHRTTFVESSRSSEPPIKEGYSNGYSSSVGPQYQQQQPDGGTIQVYTSNFGELYRFIPEDGDWTNEPMVTDSPWVLRMHSGSSRGTLGTIVYEANAFNQTQEDSSVLERRLDPDGAYASNYAGVKVIHVTGTEQYIITSNLLAKRPRRIYVVFANPSLSQTLRITANNLLEENYAPEIHLIGEGTVTLAMSSYSQIIDEWFNLRYVYYYYINTESGDNQISGNGTVARLYGSYRYSRSSSTGQVRRTTYSYNLVRILKQGT